MLRSCSVLHCTSQAYFRLPPPSPKHVLAAGPGFPRVSEEENGLFISPPTSSAEMLQTSSDRLRSRDGCNATAVTRSQPQFLFVSTLDTCRSRPDTTRTSEPLPPHLMHDTFSELGGTFALHLSRTAQQLSVCFCCRAVCFSTRQLGWFLLDLTHTSSGREDSKTCDP